MITNTENFMCRPNCSTDYLQVDHNFGIALSIMEIGEKSSEKWMNRLQNRIFAVAVL